VYGKDDVMKKKHINWKQLLSTPRARDVSNLYKDSVRTAQ